MANPDGWYGLLEISPRSTAPPANLPSPRQDIMTIEALDPDTLTWEVKFPVNVGWLDLLVGKPRPKSRRLPGGFQASRLLKS